MAEQVEEIVLRGNAKPLLDAAAQGNAALDSLEKKTGRVNAAVGKSAEAAQSGIIQVTSRNLSSVERLVAAAEKRASFAGASKFQQLAIQRDLTINRVQGDPKAIERVTAAYQKLIDTEQKQVSFSDRIRSSIQNPLQAAGEGAQFLLDKIGPLGVALGVTGAVAGLVGTRLFGLVESQGKLAEQTVNLADRLDITVDRAQKLQIAARIAGVDVGALEGSSKLLSAALEDQTGTGEKTAKALRLMGVSTVDLNGNQRESGKILIDVLDKLAKIPTQAERVARANATLGKGSKELLPMIKNLTELSAIAERLKVNPDFILQLAGADDKLDAMAERWNRFKTTLAARIGIPIFDAIEAAALQLELVGAILNRINPFTPKDKPPDSLGGLKAGAAESRAEHQRQIDDARRGSELQSQFAQRQIADIESVNKKLTQVRKDRDELENVLAGKGGQISAAAFEQKKGTFDGLERDIKRLESLKKQIEVLNARPEEIARAKSEALRSSRESLQAARADLEGSDKFSGGLASSFRKLAIEQQQEIEKVSTRVEKNGAVTRITPDQETITNIFSRFRLKRQQIELDALEKEFQATLDYIDREQQAREVADRDSRAVRDSIFRDSEQTQIETIRRRQEFETTQAGYSRDAQLRQLESINATSVSAKIGVEQQKAAIEESYITSSNDRYIRQLRQRTENEIQAQERLLRAAHATDEEIASFRFNATQSLDQSIVEANAKANADSLAVRENAAIRSTQLILDHNKQVFDSIKTSAGGVFDALLSKSEDKFSQIANIFKTAVLTAIKEVITSQIALRFTQLLTGQSASFAGQGGGGSFGGIRAALAATGLGGTAAFGAGNPAGALGPGGTSGFAGPFSLGGILNPASIGGAGAAAAGGGSSSITGAAGLAGLLGSLKGFAGFGSGGGTAAMIGPQGALGKLFGSNAAALGGGLLAADGIRRGGFIGLAETTGGGALIGNRIAPGIGALVGAAVGFTVGTIRLFIKTGQEKIIQKVHDLYGIKIDKGIAAQIQAEAKSSYGGSIDTAIRSSRIRDLLELYAQSTGQNFGGAVARAQTLSLVQSGGSLFQAPNYSNGSALPSLGGSIPSLGISGAAQQSGLQSAGPTYLSLSVNGDSAARALRGEVVPALNENPRSVAKASFEGSGANAVRRESAARFLEPGTLVS